MERKCQVLGCNNLSIMQCVGCGGTFCGQHGFAECPGGCDVGGSALMPMDHTPWAKVHEVGYEVCSVIANLEQTKLGRTLKAAIDSM